MNIGEQFFADFEEASTAETASKPAPVEDAMNIGEQFFADFEDGSAAQPAAEQEKIPDWLSDTPGSDAGDQQTESAAWTGDAEGESAQGDLTSWLNNLDNEPGLPFDSIPTPNSIKADADSKEVVAKRQKPELPKTDMLGWLSGFDESGATETQKDDWLPPEKPEKRKLPLNLLLEPPLVFKRICPIGCKTTRPKKKSAKLPRSP